MLSKNKTRSPAYAAHAVGVKKGRIDVPGTWEVREEVSSRDKNVNCYMFSALQ